MSDGIKIEADNRINAAVVVLIAICCTLCAPECTGQQIHCLTKAATTGAACE